MPKRAVLAAACCGFVATAATGIAGDALHVDGAVVIVVSVVIGVLVLLVAAALIDELMR